MLLVHPTLGEAGVARPPQKLFNVLAYPNRFSFQTLEAQLFLMVMWAPRSITNPFFTVGLVCIPAAQTFLSQLVLQPEC